MSHKLNLLYVFTALLLHFFATTLATEPWNTDQQQDHQLIKEHGLIHHVLFNQQCQKTLAQLAITTTCQVLNSDMINAFSLADGNLVISLGLLKKTRNRDQMAHVLAHEFAHHQLDHFHELAQFIAKPPTFFPKRKLHKLRQKQEHDADDWADERLQAHGFDHRQIHHLWQQLSQSEQLKKWSDHAPLQKRIDPKALQATVLIDPEWRLLIRDLSQR